MTEYREDPQFRLSVPGLAELRVAAFETEWAIRMRGVGEAVTSIERLERKFEAVPSEYVAFRLLFGLTIAELKKRRQSPGFRSSRQAAVPAITAIIALLGPRFLGREIVAQFGGPCDVCGEPCAKGEAVIYQGATKRGAHASCGELEK